MIASGSSGIAPPVFEGPGSRDADGKAADLGTVQTGRIADLVLLDANPLEDIRNKERISAVILGGKLLRRPDLDLLLRQAEEMA